MFGFISQPLSNTSPVQQLLKHEHLWRMCGFNSFCSNMFLFFMHYFSALPQQHYVDRSRNLFYLSPTKTSHCSGNWRQVVYAEKQDTRCLQMNSVLKWTDYLKEILTGRQTSGSNSPLYAGLAVLRLFLSCRLLWISDKNQNTICDVSLILIIVFVCLCFCCFIQSWADFRKIGFFQIWIWS